MSAFIVYTKSNKNPNPSGFGFLFYLCLGVKVRCILSQALQSDTGRAAAGDEPSTPRTSSTRNGMAVVDDHAEGRTR